MRNLRISLIPAVLCQAQAQVRIQDCGGTEGRHFSKLASYPGCSSGLGTRLVVIDITGSDNCGVCVSATLFLVPSILERGDSPGAQREERLSR